MAKPLFMRDLYRTPVFSARGRRIGRVVEVLVHPSQNRVVGFVVERPRLLYLLDRKDRLLAFSAVTLSSEGVVVSSDTEAWDAPAARRLGIDWESSVIWSGMPVRTVSRTRLGTVHEFSFDADDGEIRSMQVSGGATADLALGHRDVDASEIVGYRDGAVVVADPAAESETAGGAAAAAGRGAAVARKQVAGASVAAGRAAKSAVQYGTTAARAAAQSRTGKKTISWLKSMRDELVDAMGDPDDDE